MACMALAGVVLFAFFHPALFPFRPLPHQQQTAVFIGCGVVFVLGLLTLVASVRTLRYRRFRAWECAEGFLAFDQADKLQAALRWDQIQAVWHRVSVTTANEGGGAHYTHHYSVQGPDGREIELNYPHLWKRIETEFVRLHLPQALTTINTGGSVSFLSVIASRQGLATNPSVSHLREKLLPGSVLPRMIPWPSLSCIRVKRSLLEFEAWSMARKPVFQTALSDTPNVCLLKALVQTMSGGRVTWLEQA